MNHCQISRLKSPDIVLPLVGRSTIVTVEKARELLELRQGNLIRGQLPKNRDAAASAMRFCREHRIYVLLGECVRRGELSQFSPLPPDELAEAVAEAGEFCLGIAALGESGGMFYWPKYYTINRACGDWENLPPCDSPAEAHDNLLSLYRKTLEYQRRNVSGDLPLFTIESCQILDYQFEAGCDFAAIEAGPGTPLPLFPAFRGAARARSTIWGSHIAIGWYGGIRVDRLWMKRWKLYLHLSFLAGADFIYPESGEYEYHMQRNDDFPRFHFDFDHPKMRESRRVLREFYRFTRIHRRPAGGPATPTAVALGHLEGFPNLWNPNVWGQYSNPVWQAGPAEAGWNLLDLFHRKKDVFEEDTMGEYNVSGNPPGGQFDIVPMDSGDISRYGTLIFIGWNTMTEELHEKLLRFVENGGRLLIWPAHFNIAEKRGDALRLFRDGDLSELAGYRITGWGKKDDRGFKFTAAPSILADFVPYWGALHDPVGLGRITPAQIQPAPDTKVIAGYSYVIDESASAAFAEPALIEHRIGNGFVWSVAAQEYPGDVGMRNFSATIIRILLAAAEPEVQVVGSESVRYAVYKKEIDGETLWLIYLLNTDTEVSANVRIMASGRVSDEIRVEDAGFRVVYLLDGHLLIPEIPDLRIEHIRRTVEGFDLDLFLPGMTAVKVEPLTASPKRFRFNNTENRIPARPDPMEPELYQTDYLEEKQ